MKPLGFLHITKTGGTAIETAAFEHGLLWGSREALEWDKASPGPAWHRPPTKERRSLCDWFTVVRHPVDRCVSEFHCPWEGWTASNATTPTQDQFNAFVVNNLRTIKRIGHWWPQHEFIWTESGERYTKYVLHFENLHNEFNLLMQARGLDVRLLERHRVNDSTKYFGVKDLYPETVAMIYTVYAEDFRRLGYGHK